MIYKGVRFREDWLWRTRIVAGMIPKGSRIIEFGAGERRLKDFLPEGCSYTGYDIEEFDLESEEWPILPEYDIAVFCGVLEWLDNPIAAIKKAKASIIIFTYNVFFRHINGIKEREEAGWKNHFSELDLLLAIALETGLNTVLETNHWKYQSIIKMGRKDKGEA